MEEIMKNLVKITAFVALFSCFGLIGMFSDAQVQALSQLVKEQQELSKIANKTAEQQERLKEILAEIKSYQDTAKQLHTRHGRKIIMEN